MKLFYKRDWDGFFGLAVDNLVQLLLIIFLFEGVMLGAVPDSDLRRTILNHLVYARILPAAAVSIIIGNLFYAFLAHRLARREKREDVCALPYGINTVSLIVFFWFVILPTFQESLKRTPGDFSGAANAAWKLGLLACLGSGVIEFVGAFVAERVRQATPRAALLSTLAGIAIGFISMTFALQIWQSPLVSLVPLGVILLTYFGRVQFRGLPGGFVALVVGTALGWGFVGLKLLCLHFGWNHVPLLTDRYATETTLSPCALSTSVSSTVALWQGGGLHWPIWCGQELWSVVIDGGQWAQFSAVIVAMGLFNVIGSLQNIESAEAGGDKYPTLPALAVNGLGTIAAALFGSCFPTTIYIGHPGWKALGARAGYSTLNGLFFVLICLTGLVGVVSAFVPMQAGMGIVLWIGIIITAQAFSATPKEHAPAVAVGLFPAIAAWGATVVMGAFLLAGKALSDVPFGLESQSQTAGFLVWGMVILERGYILTCMILAAATACLIESNFKAAYRWMLAAGVCTLLGLMHAFSLQPGPFRTPDYLFLFQGWDTSAFTSGSQPANGAIYYRAWGQAIAYLAVAGLFYWVHRRRQTGRGGELGAGHG